MSQNGVCHALVAPINYWDHWTPDCSIPVCAAAQETSSKALQGFALSFMVMSTVLSFLKFTHSFECTLNSYYECKWCKQKYKQIQTKP